MSRVVAILGTRYTDFSIEERALAGCDAELRSDPGSDAESIVAAAGDAEVILAGSGPRFDADVLGRLRCRGIVRYGVGVERIDLEAARERGIWVARVVEYGTEAVALHAVTLALAGIRRLREADARVRGGGWGFADLRPLRLPGSLHAGVLGFGRIGRRTAEMLGALGFKLLAHDPLVEPAGVPGVEAVSLAELLARSDVISLHAPGPADGSALLGRDELAGMAEGSVLVNTARGSLVDPVALAESMRAGRPLIAALDVFAGEPPDLQAAFADLRERLIVTPHMAWYTEESERTMREKAAASARRLLDGERPEDVVVEPEPGGGAS